MFFLKLLYIIEYVILTVIVVVLSTFHLAVLQLLTHAKAYHTCTRNCLRCFFPHHPAMFTPLHL